MATGFNDYLDANPYYQANLGMGAEGSVTAEDGDRILLTGPQAITLGYMPGTMVNWSDLSEDQRRMFGETARKMHIAAETEKRKKNQAGIRMLAIAAILGGAAAAAGGAGGAMGATTGGGGGPTVAVGGGKTALAGGAKTALAGGSKTAVAGAGKVALTGGAKTALAGGAKAAVASGAKSGLMAGLKSAWTGMSATKKIGLIGSTIGQGYTAYKNAEAQKAQADFLRDESLRAQAWEAERVNRIRNGPLAKIAPFLMQDALSIYGGRGSGMDINQAMQMMGVSDLSGMTPFTGFNGPQAPVAGTDNSRVANRAMGGR